MDTPLTFDVSELNKKSEGSIFEYSLDVEVDFNEQAIVSKSNLTGRVFIMKLKEGFHVQVKGIKIDVELKCGKCAEIYTQKVEIPSAELLYLNEPSKQMELQKDLSYVDVKNWTLDITEFLRQEIILHFPLIPVCSTRCKGINLEKNV
jgi:uncharacterized metal-binding protein YceD (DUF177 family)